MHAGDQGSAAAFSTILRGRVLHQFVMLASIVPPATSQGQRAGGGTEAPASHNARLRGKCSELAAGILHAAALSKDLGLWTVTEGQLCSAQAVTQRSICLPHSMFDSAREQQAAVPLHKSPYEYLTAGGSISSPNTTSLAQCLQEDTLQASGMHCECKLLCTAAQVMQPRKALQGVPRGLQQL